MGDYNVQIISARLKTDMTEEQFREECLQRLPLRDSAYHATSPFLQTNWEYGKTISMITQAKYNRGVEEFIEWLRPMVCAGMGEDEVWAVNFSEYRGEPKLEKTTYRDD